MVKGSVFLHKKNFIIVGVKNGRDLFSFRIYQCVVFSGNLEDDGIIFKVSVGVAIF